MTQEVFNSFWIDTDDNVWGLRVEDGGMKLYTQSSGDWVEVTFIPLEVWEDIEEEYGRK